MSYRVVCKQCGAGARVPQRRGVKMRDYRCVCGGGLRRIGWQEVYRECGQANRPGSVTGSSDKKIAPLPLPLPLPF